MKIGILTGGGDAPGLNGIIEAAARVLLKSGHSLTGICDGFAGIFDHQTIPLDEKMIAGAHARAGTLLGTSNRSGTQGREDEFLRAYRALGLDGLVVAGGDGTFNGLKAFQGQIRVVGVPKTIDNDINGTDISFGFDTACSVVARAVDSLRATADAHSRVFVVETMGRTAGWIALGGGLASYSDVILMAERPVQPQDLLKFIRGEQKRKRGLMITMAEGVNPRFGGGAEQLARMIESETGWESRHVVLGHLQRSEHPTTTDRFLTLSMGVEVARLVNEGLWDHAAVYRQGRVTRAPIAELMGPPRLVTSDHRWVQLAQAVGIYC